MIIQCFVGATLFAAVVAINVYNYRTVRDGNWHFHALDTMRRMAPTGWEYRPATGEEVDEYRAIAW